jgi:hypothetical protein
MTQWTHAFGLSALLLVACATPLSAAAQPIGLRCLVVGDSNVAVTAHEIVRAGAFFPHGAVVFDFAAVAHGTGLSDVEAFEARVLDPLITDRSYDCVIVNLGLNDLWRNDDRWQAFFTGTAPGGMPYHARIQRLLAALPNVPIYWIGVPQGSPLPAVHPWEVAAVDIAIACFDDPARFAGFCAPGVVEDPRLRYVSPDPLIGSQPPLRPDGLHYTQEAATALFDSLVARIRAEN